MYTNQKQMKEERGEGCTPRQFLTPQSNIIIHDSAAVTVFGTVHSSQANLNHFITVLASSGSIIDH